MTNLGTKHTDALRENPQGRIRLRKLPELVQAVGSNVAVSGHAVGACRATCGSRSWSHCAACVLLQVIQWVLCSDRLLLLARAEDSNVDADQEIHRELPFAVTK